MKLINLIVIICLFTLTFQTHIHHRFSKIESEAKNQDFDICSELNSHLNNLFIDANTYADVDQEFPNTDESLGLAFTKQITWTKMADIAAAKGQQVVIFGENDIKPSDIKQGALGDCYFLAALSGLANCKPEYLRSIFDEQSEIEKEKGIFTTNWIINGQQIKVSVDSWIPTYVETGEPVFTSFKNDFEFWPIILEKAWAKIYGSYQNINAGCTATVYKALTNAPPFYYTHSLTISNSLWEAVKTNIENKMPLSVGTQSYSIYGLPKSHAYTPIGTCEHKFENGTLLRLVKMQNPWGVEVYKGPFNDNDAQWTQQLRDECGSVQGNDGEFFMPIEIYKMVFVSTSGAKLQDGFMNTILKSDEIPNDNLYYEDSYEVIVNSGTEQQIYIGVDFLDYRFNSMLPEECAIMDDHISMYIMSEDFTFMKKIFDDTSVSSYHAEVSGYSKYYIFLKRRIQSSVIKDYTVNVYAPQQAVSIQKSSVDRKNLFLANLEQNKDKGRVVALQKDVNIIANVPVTGDSYSYGLIIDNKSLAKVLTIELAIYTKLYEVISEICSRDTSYSSTTYQKYHCKSKLYPHEQKPVLFQHSNEFGTTYLKIYYKYSIQ